MHFFLPNSPLTSAASALAVLPEYSSLCTPKGMSLRAMAMPSGKGNHILVYERHFRLTQRDTIKNPSSYQSVLVQRFPPCCQTGHNHTSRKASMSSSHHWEREERTSSGNYPRYGFKNVKENVNVNSSTHFLTSSIPSGNLRAVANSRATVNSAVASVRTSGVYPTRIPLIKINHKVI